MNAKSKNSHRNWRGPDDAPEITDKWLEGANLYRGKKLVRRGRPPTAVRNALIARYFDKRLGH